MSALAKLTRLALIGGIAAMQMPAQSTPPPVDPELRARFGFLGPTIHKIGMGIDLLRVADLDGEGGAEIVVHNPRRGRLEILSLEGDSVAVRTESVAGQVRGLQLADVDGDGGLDVLTVSDRGRLGVRLSRGGRIPEIEVGLPGTDCLRVGDLDGDDRADAVVLTQDGLRIARRLADGAVVSPPVPLGDARVLSAGLFDLDGDGELDIVLATDLARMPLRVKLGRGDGEFGEWLLMDIPRLARAFPGTGGAGAPTLVAIEGAHRRIVEYSLRREGGHKPSQQLTTLPTLTRATPFPFAHGDVDGDGDRDLVIAHPDQAQLVFLLEDAGRFRSVTAPTLAGISSLDLGDIDGDGRLDLVLASSEEEALAWKPGTAPLGAFPVRIPTPDRPAAVAIAGRSVYLLTRSSRREGALHRIDWQGDGFGEPHTLVGTGRLAGDPLRLLVADLDGRFGDDVALVVPGVGLQVVRNGPDGYVEPDPDAGAGFTRRMDDGALSLVRRDGQPALLVVRARFARTFRLDDGGQPSILDQDNGPAGTTELLLGAVMDDGSRLFLDKDGKLYRVTEGRATVSVDVAPIGATHLLGHGDSAILIGQRGVLRVPFGASYGLEPQRTHEPPTNDTAYWSGLAADLDADGSAELALLDQDIHGLHVLVPGGDTLRRALSFPVFEQKDDMPNLAEPREIVAGDVDGDGRDDLVMIAHDRVLIYRQEK